MECFEQYESFSSAADHPFIADVEQDQELCLDTVEEEEEFGEVAESEEEMEEVASVDHCDDAIKLYLREIRKSKLLTAGEERELARRMEAGDSSAREKMITCNLRLVVSVAKRYMNRGLPLSDLIEEGNIGLIKAVDRFQISKECRFSTYAIWWIRQSVERALANQSRTVRLPVHISEDLSKMNKATHAFRGQMKREPSLVELASLMGEEPERVRKLMVFMKHNRSLDQPMGEQKDFFLLDTLEDTSGLASMTLIEDQESYELAAKLIQGFPEADKKILTLRFGLDNKEPQTLDTIGQSFGVTRERIRQIETKLLSKLRKLMEVGEVALAH